MAGRIPQPFIDQVLNQTDIVDLISEFVELKQKGKEYTACCPFHHEKTPSFTVSPDKQFYHCFGCGAHGTAISFMIEREGLEFVEAIEFLSNRLGQQVPYESTGEQRNQHIELYRVLEQADKYFQKQLRSSKPAIEYLKQRGITGQVADVFSLGFAPEGFDNLKNYLAQSFEKSLLVTVGLLSEKSKDRVYDRFRNRIMFPIKDTRGRVIAFGGRSLGDEMPKYINSPETPLFHKGNNLYGLYEARKSSGRISQLIIVEGYMDVVALAQHGITNCVATLGTATTTQHIRTLLRYSSELVFCFDGDRAGKAAAWKALEQLLPEYKDGIDIRFAFMPQGEDPDSLIRDLGKDAFIQHLKKSTPLSEYFFDKLAMEIDCSTPDGRARLANAAKPLIGSLPKSVFRDLMNKELSERVGTRIGDLTTLKPSRYDGSKKQDNHQRAPKYTKTRLAIALLLREPTLVELALPIEELSILNTVPGVPLLIQLIGILEENPELSPATLVERFHGKEAYPHLQKLLEWDPPDMENRKESFQHTMDRFKEDIQRAHLDAIIGKNE